MPELKKGDVVAGLVVKERIGCGGMGEVFLVHDSKLAVDRALKLIALSGPGFRKDSAEPEEYRQRFVREARTLARLRHPNIIAVHSYGEVEENPYLVMSYFPSRDARKWLNEEKPSLERVRGVGLQVAKALEHAHAHDVLHRDIKLTNILVGAGDEAMLIDFGLAKGKLDSDLTRTGRSMGTFSYLAPEYVKASTVGKPIHTVLTDLWAVGCVLYALTCRKAAFHDKDELRLLGAIQRAEFIPVKDAVPGVPDAWAALIHRLMEPDPAKRVQSARELVALLTSVSLSAALPPSASPSPECDDVENVESEPRAAVPASVIEALAAPLSPTQRERPAPAPSDEAVSPTNLAQGSLFESGGEPSTPSVKPPTAPLAPPSFQPPAESTTSARSMAKRRLLLPLGAAAAVLILGGMLIAWSDHARARPASHDARRAGDLDRQERGQREIEELERERERQAQTVLPAPAPRESLPSTVNESSNQPLSSPRVVPALSHSKPTAPEAVDPWARRYGARSSFNTSSSPTDAPSVAAADAPKGATAAGTRVSVRINDVVASSPPGPVIAVVEARTSVGPVELPAGAEVHGRVAGASGNRILIEFSFAIVRGERIPLKGVALGLDGRVGIAATKSIGGASDVAAGAASGAAQAALDAAAGALGGVAGAAIRGSSGAAVGKASRLDNEDAILLSERSPRLFVYIER